MRLGRIPVPEGTGVCSAPVVRRADTSPEKLWDFSIGRGELTLIAGPCSLETPELGLEIAETVRDICASLGVRYIFKASFDKANRTSLSGFRGPGLDAGLEQLAEIRRKASIPVLTDIHESWQAEPAARAVDVLQIPAFLCRQTDLLLAAAGTGKPLNVKKAQFLAPGDMKHVVEKCRQGGCSDLMLCERGTFMGYGQLVVDMRSLPLMRALDARSSSTPRTASDARRCWRASGGDRRFVLPLARAPWLPVSTRSSGDAPRPEKAKSDGPNLVPGKMRFLLEQLAELHAFVRERFGRLSWSGRTKRSRNKGEREMFCLPWEREGRCLSDVELLETGRGILHAEAAEIERAAQRTGLELVKAARIVHSCTGRLVVVGMGKSGIIGRKIAATLASLGTPSFFLHAAEGSHGDLGMVCRDDAALFISNSGTTAEVVSLLRTSNARRRSSPSPED